MATEQITAEGIIEAARRAARETGGVLSRRDFVRLTGINDYHIYKLFPDGGWQEVLRCAGLEKHPQFNETLSDDELLAEFHRIAAELGDIPSWHRFAARARVGADTVRKRFGGIQGTLKRYRGWLDEHEPDSPLLAKLHARSQHEIPAPPTPPESAPGAPTPQWSRGNGVEYGPPISFRGLRHAPINEQGVVYLFGMVSYELGFLVEAIHTSYPDCEAKRCVDRRNGRWQRVRIEFEYRSSAFRAHGHDPAGCDVIVCWEHDWPECSLDVVELRRVINDLEG